MTQKIKVLPPGFLKNFKPKRYKILSLDIVKAGFLSVAVVALVFGLTTQKASAAPTSTAPARCADTSWLAEDDWVTAASKHYVTIMPANVKGLLKVIYPDYDAANFSMIIGRPAGSPYGTHNLNLYGIYNSGTTDHWEFVKDSTGYYAQPSTGTTTVYSFNQLNDYNWNGTTSNPKGWPYVAGNPQYFSPSSTPKLGFDCVTQVKNVTYAAGWDGPAFSTKLIYGASEVKCDKLDIGCWIGKAWTGVTDTFTSVGQAILSGIANLFAPDGDEIQAQFNDLNDFMHTKLGFLTFPFDFLGDLFGAFTSGSAWCTETSCTKNFGNLFGHSYTVNFNTFKETMPTMWSWFSGLIRGTTILILILAIRRKYMGVVGK